MVIRYTPMYLKDSYPVYNSKREIIYPNTRREVLQSALFFSCNSSYSAFLLDEEINDARIRYLSRATLKSSIAIESSVDRTEV